MTGGKEQDALHERLTQAIALAPAIAQSGERTTKDEDPTHEQLVVLGLAEEQVLDWIALLKRPFDDAPAPLVSNVFAQRSGKLYLNFLDAVHGRAPETCITQLRPLVEANIVLRFILENAPSLSFQLWLADDELKRQRWFGELRLLAERSERWAEQLDHLPGPDESADAYIDELRAQAIKHGICGVSEKSKALLPSVDVMARWLGKHAGDVAADEGYVFSYRSLSNFLHLSAGTFDVFGDTEHTVDGRLVFDDGGARLRPYVVRVHGLVTMASTLLIASHRCKLGIAQQIATLKRIYIPHEPIPADEDVTANEDAA